MQQQLTPIVSCSKTGIENIENYACGPIVNKRFWDKTILIDVSTNTLTMLAYPSPPYYVPTHPFKQVFLAPG